MSSCGFRISTSTNHRRLPPPLFYNCATAAIYRVTFIFRSSTACSSSSFSSEINAQRSYPMKRKSWSGCCRATSPPSEQPSNKHPSTNSGVAASISRFQDTLQIFFAVLFWMSLFFWSSAWDGKNGGRPNKGSRFRK